MKKRERVQSILTAILFVRKGFATKEAIAAQVAGGVIGTVTPAEVEVLLHPKKGAGWTPEIAKQAADLGLVVGRVRGARKSGGGGAGGVQKVFAEKYKELYTGKRVPSEKELELVDELVVEFGVHPILGRVRKIVSDKTEYQVGQYFLLKGAKIAKAKESAGIAQTSVPAEAKK